MTASILVVGATGTVGLEFLVLRRPPRSCAAWLDHNLTRIVSTGVEA
jgi:hypothetical protein